MKSKNILLLLLLILSSLFILNCNSYPIIGITHYSTAEQKKEKTDVITWQLIKINDTVIDKSKGLSIRFFKNTASLYSVSDSSKLGGDIGWINESSLSTKILKELNNIKIGDFVKPINIGKNYLILKIENIKSEIIEVDKKKKIEKIIQFEKNRQLEQFSNIYFNQMKINTNINEF